MKKLKTIQNLWVKLTVVFMLANVFIPSMTVLADQSNSNSNQPTTEQVEGEKADESMIETEKDNDTQASSEIEAPIDQNKMNETTIGESQNSNDSPILPIETPTFEVQEPSAKMITFNENGTPLLDGETFYKTEEQIRQDRSSYRRLVYSCRFDPEQALQTG